jgi:hypothetical protein
MASIDIFNVKPHQMSRDMRGYSVFLYGGWKTGKTTTAVKFPKHFLLAFEKGYSAIPGAMAQPINSWSEFRQVLRQLKEDKAKETFETIIIDTADIAYDYCVKYVCANAPRPKEQGGGVGVDSLSDIPFGKGYGMVEKEFDECLRKIVQLGYGLVVISHEADKTFKNENGTEFNKIVPTLDKRANNVLARMCDIIGYTRSIPDEAGNERIVMFMRGTSRYEAGSRFKYTPEYIELSYDNLVKAIGEAIDKQMEEVGSDLFTNERENVHIDTTSELDFDALMKEFNDIIANVPGSTDVTGETEEGKKFKEYWQPRIVQVIEKYLGKGRKMNDCTRDQVEAVDLIVSELKELVKE